MIIRAITQSVSEKQTKFILYFKDGVCLKVYYYHLQSQGYSVWGSCFGVNDVDFEQGIVGGAVIINWMDLPSLVQAHIEQVLYQRGDG